MSTTQPAPWLPDKDKVGELRVMFCKQEGASRCRMKASWWNPGTVLEKVMTAGWPASWTQAVGGAVPPLFGNVRSCPLFPRRELFQELV